ncbi:MAG: hypothetical protein RLZZ282_1577 [Verrucomicrobiota bacterium]
MAQKPECRVSRAWRLVLRAVDETWTGAEGWGEAILSKQQISADLSIALAHDEVE